MQSPSSNGHHLPYVRALRPLAGRLRRNATRAEQRLWYDFLRLQRPPWHRQKPLDRFIADFYCARLRLVLEVDGPTHLGAEAVACDAARTVVLEQYGLYVLRITNADVLHRFYETCTSLAQWFEARRRWLESPGASRHPL